MERIAVGAPVVRAVVSGGTGFIGSHLTERLLRDGHEVVVLDNFVTGRRANLAAVDGHHGLTVVETDICVAVPVEGPVDAVFHLASPASPSDFLRIPLEILEVGSTGTRAMLELSRRTGARYLYASTSEVYGDPLVHPQPETYLGNVDPIGPRGCYDEAKRFGEALTMAYRRMHHVRTVIVRIFNTYGPRMRPDDGRVLSTFIGQALAGEPITVHGDGSQTRSYCYVDDLVEGLLAAASGAGEGPYNLGSTEELTVAQLARTVVDVTGSASEIVFQPLPPERAGDPQRRRPDLARTVAEVGWQPRVTVVDGVARMVEAAVQERARR